jgi:hypothetical protein
MRLSGKNDSTQAVI